MADRRRVAITGIGALTPIGITRDALWQGLLARRSAVRPVTRFDASIYRSQIAAEIDFHASDFIEERKVKRLDRFGQFTVACSRLAIEDAHLDMAVEDRERVGSMMGSALGGVGFAEEQFGVFLTQGIKNVAVSLATNVFAGAASCNVAIEFGAQGPNSTNAMSCASGTMGIGQGFREIRDDYADVMICGGVEAPLNQLCFGAFALIRAMSTRNDDPVHASRPFDRDRDGFVMGEGAGVVVIEALDHALARGAEPIAELIGYGTTLDAFHMTAGREDGDGAKRAMQIALQQAGISARNSSISTRTRRRLLLAIAASWKRSRPSSATMAESPSAQPSPPPAICSAPPGVWKRSSRCWRCAIRSRLKRSTSTIPIPPRRALI